MAERVVIGLDSSTQSTKAIAWSEDGGIVAEGRAPHPLDLPAPGHVEQDAESWWAATCAALRAVTAAVDPARIEALAISSQRETMVFTDAEGRPIAPATVWLDGRAAETLKDFAAEFGAERLHRITGKMPDVIPSVYRLHWFRRHDPALLDRAARILDVHGFLMLRLAGAALTTATSADPMGLFDIAGRRWSAPILAALGIDEDRLPAVRAQGACIGRVSAAGAAATGLREGTAIFAAGGDGQCAGLGADAMRAGAVYLNLGTSVVAGLWSAAPATGRHWRTLCAPVGSGYFLEAVQRAGTFLLNWLIDGFAQGFDAASSRAARDPSLFARLEAAAAAVPLGAEGLLVSPHLTGCMDPHWDPSARAAVIGLGAHHGIAHLYRAALEAMSVETARALAAMRDAGFATEEIRAIGGGAGSPLWRRMIADATGLPLRLARSNEASSLGAAIIAAVGAGWFRDIDAAIAAMTGTAETIAPDPTQRAAWETLSRRQSQLYPTVAPFNK